MSISDRNLFPPVSFAGGITLRNRVVMAPMTTWSANGDGTVSNDEEIYYRRRVKGVGLVIPGCTHVQANGIGFTGEFAARNDRFIPSLKKLADAAKSGGAAQSSKSSTPVSRLLLNRCRKSCRFAERRQA
jgi:2,4-dienoyl-CoA reductase-like NADH-dependent reductase (Old Yellow Enzyme family)